MYEFYSIVRIALFGFALITSLTDKYYPFILILLFLSQLLLGNLSYSLNIYQLTPLMALFSFGLAIFSIVLRKRTLAMLFVFQGLMYAWYLSVDLYAAATGEGEKLLAVFLYNSLHPDYVYTAIPAWMNLVSIMELAILFYVVIMNGICIYTYRGNLVNRMADNLRYIREFFVHMAVEIRKDIKTKNPKALYQAWKNHS